MTSLTSCSHSDDVSHYSVHAVISVLSIKSFYWGSVFVFNIINGSRARFNGSWEFIENAVAVNGEV